MIRPPFEHSWRVPVAVQEIPETGRQFILAADEPTRAAIAEVAGLAALPRLAATFEVTRHGRAGLRVAGQVSAMVGQMCVVTLDPMENEIEEVVDLVFVPGAAPAPPEESDGAEVPAEDVPEPLIDGTVDLGAIATEFLILGIDPYPRKSEVAFEPPKQPADEAPSPFAALAALQKSRYSTDR